MRPDGHPARLFRFPPARRARETTPIFVPTVPGFGTPGAATFALLLDSGARVTYSWSTDIFRSYSSNEQRSSPFGSPRMRIEGTLFLIGDAVSRDQRSALMRAAAAGSAFLVALPFEEVLIVADSIGTTMSVASTLTCDWAVPGQRVLVMGPDGSTLPAVVQSTTPSTITLGAVDAAGNLMTAPGLGTAGLAGGRLMPLLPVLLDPQQAFARYPVTLDTWTIRAQTAAFGWAGVDSMGAGTSITTYTAGGQVPVAELKDDDLLIWDRPNAIDGTAGESLLSGAELVDLGALPFEIGGQVVPDWARSIRFHSSDPADWQWFKAFLRHLRGRQGAFLLATNRADVLYLANTGDGILVASSSVPGAGDYASWFASGAHRRLAATLADGSIQYVTVTGLVETQDGTLSLTLDASIVGAVAKVSLLEQVRFEEDDIAVTWDAGTFSVELVARAVQETIVPPSLFVFDTVLDRFFTLPIAPPKILREPLGKVTLIHWTSDRSLSVAGVHADGGNLDGMVMCVCNTNNNSFGMALLHENATADPEDRMRLAGNSSIDGVNLAMWFVYRGAIRRCVAFLSV